VVKGSPAELSFRLLHYCSKIQKIHINTHCTPKDKSYLPGISLLPGMGNCVGSDPMPNTDWREEVGLLPDSLFAESRECQWNENVALYVQLIQNTEVC